MIIDTHSHLNFNAYKDDLDKVAKRTQAENVWVVNVGSNYENSKLAIDIAEKYGEGFFAAVGLHPIHLASDFFKIKKDTNEQEGDDTNADNFDMAKYKELAQNKKVVAIGEIGLDYYYRPKGKTKTDAFKARQKEYFIKQLDLAKELNLPVIFHCRMAHSEMIDIISNFQFPISNFQLRGVIHCFTGSWEEAQKYMELGFHIGFNGIIDKLDLNEVIRKIPLNKILVETDCPYLCPSEALAKEGLTGITRNEPIFVKHVAQKIADLKGITFVEVVSATTANAKKLFKI